ncbi:MAG: hypothetical protein ACYCYO_01570 [Bacilli bacterium]
MENDDFSWPQKDNKLFITNSPAYYQFSHIGWGSESTQRFGYIKGYKDSADCLVKTALESGSTTTLDTFVYPIIFLYRQFVELSMKSIYLNYSEDSIEDKVRFIKSVSHKLRELWCKIRPVIEQANQFEKDHDFLGIVEDYVVQFHEFDESSFTFRYPFTKNLTPTLNEEQRIDIKNFALRVDELANFFSGVDAQLDEIKQWKAEE